MSFRRRLITMCDDNLRGDGFRYEMDLCLTVQEMGYLIVMDSEAVNDHWCAPRKEGPDRRNKRVVLYDNSYNEAYTIAKHKKNAARYMARQLFYVGPRAAIGSVVRRNPYAFYHLCGVLAGFAKGMTAGRRVHRTNMVNLSVGRFARF